MNTQKKCGIFPKLKHYNVNGDGTIYNFLYEILQIIKQGETCTYNIRKISSQKVKQEIALFEIVTNLLCSKKTQSISMPVLTDLQGQ